MNNENREITFNINVNRSDRKGESGLAFHIHVSEENWPHFIKFSLQNVVKFSHDINNACLGCLATNWTKVFEDMNNKDLLEDHLIGMAQLALGLDIMFKGVSPQYDDVYIDLCAIEKKFAHDQDNSYTDTPEPTVKVDPDNKTFH